MVGDEVGRDPALEEIGLLEERPMEGDGGRRSGEHELLERPPSSLDRLLTGGPEDDQLGQQRIEVRRYLLVGADSGIDSHARSAGRSVAPDSARSGEEVPRRVLGVDPELDRMSSRAVRLRVEPIAGGDADLLPYQVDSQYGLGDRMFDLEPGVHLEKV